MATVLPFPSAGRTEAPRFLVRAKALQDVCRHLQAAATDMAEEVHDLLEGDRPTPNDHSASGKVAGQIGEALRLLILANGVPHEDQALATALNRWLSREHRR